MQYKMEALHAHHPPSKAWRSLRREILLSALPKLASFLLEVFVLAPVKLAGASRVVIPVHQCTQLPLQGPSPLPTEITLLKHHYYAS